MADVKKFTGFIAIDGSTHTTSKSAVEHSRQVKIQRALAEKFTGPVVLDGGDNAPTYEDQEPLGMPDFIYANRDAILACLNQDVLTRKKRAPNKAKAADAANGATATATPAAEAEATA